MTDMKPRPGRAVFVRTELVELSVSDDNRPL
jgi:hypothetical protein